MARVSRNRTWGSIARAWRSWHAFARPALAGCGATAGSPRMKSHLCDVAACWAVQLPDELLEDSPAWE